MVGRPFSYKIGVCDHLLSWKLSALSPTATSLGVNSISDVGATAL